MDAIHLFKTDEVLVFSRPKMEIDPINLLQVIEQLRENMEKTDDLPEFLPKGILKQCIDWNSHELENYRVFEFYGQTFYLIYSRPTLNSYNGDRFRVVNTVVVSSSEEEAIKKFEELMED